MFSAVAFQALIIHNLLVLVVLGDSMTGCPFEEIARSLPLLLSFSPDLHPALRRHVSLISSPSPLVSLDDSHSRPERGRLLSRASLQQVQVREGLGVGMRMRMSGRRVGRGREGGGEVEEDQGSSAGAEEGAVLHTLEEKRREGSGEANKKRTRQDK